MYLDLHEVRGPGPVRDGLQALTEREKETLRLLLRGHDAKSIARAQGLSVHTVHERLREARRKLDVSSSREAARRLAEADLQDPHFLADEKFGVAGAIDMPKGRAPRAANWLAWLGGGMLIMSLIITAIALSSSLHVGSATEQRGGAAPPPVAAAPGAPDRVAAKTAGDWLALLDRKQWNESWQAAASLFRSNISSAQWASTAGPLRQPLGPVLSRNLQTVTRTSALPGAPSGEYEVTQFETKFAHKDPAIETVVLAREGDSWRVAGYFLK